MDDLSERPTKLINRTLRESCDENITTRDIANIRQSIYRARRSVLPPLPQSLEDVHEAWESIQYHTNKGENFLLVNNRQLHIIIFSCKTNLKILCTSDKIYIDGTFDYCANFFVNYLLFMHSKMVIIYQWRLCYYQTNLIQLIR